MNCDQCKKPFDEYDQPKYLPCSKTKCTKCEFIIEKEAINKQFLKADTFLVKAKKIGFYRLR